MDLPHKQTSSSGSMQTTHNNNGTEQQHDAARDCTRKRTWLGNYRIGNLLRQRYPLDERLRLGLPSRLVALLVGHSWQGKSSAINGINLSTKAAGSDYIELAPVGRSRGVATTPERIHYRLALPYAEVLLSDTRGFIRRAHWQAELLKLISGVPVESRADDIAADPYRAVNRLQEMEPGRAHVLFIVLRDTSITDEEKMAQYRDMGKLAHGRIPYLYVVTHAKLPEEFDSAAWEDKLDVPQEGMVLPVEIYNPMKSRMSDERKNSHFLTLLLKAIELADTQGLTLREPTTMEVLRAKLRNAKRQVSSALPSKMTILHQAIRLFVILVLALAFSRIF